MVCPVLLAAETPEQLDHEWACTERSFVLHSWDHTTSLKPLFSSHATCLFITCSRKHDFYWLPAPCWRDVLAGPASTPALLRLSLPSQGWMPTCQQSPDTGSFCLLWQERKEQFAGKGSTAPSHSGAPKCSSVIWKEPWCRDNGPLAIF